MDNKKIILVHGWGGNPKNAWFPWLKRELEKLGDEVIVPSMPNSSEPDVSFWVEYLTGISDSIDENTYFVGHSIGCLTIIKYLENLSKNVKIGGVIFVAGFFTLQNLETDEELEIARPWLNLKIDYERVKSHTDNFFALFSDDDLDVSIENVKFFEERLGARTLVQTGKGHFSDDDGVFEVPVVLEELSK